MWRTVPNFNNYEYNSQGVVRNKKTKVKCARRSVSFNEFGYSLIDDSGKSHLVKESHIFAQKGYIDSVRAILDSADELGTHGDPLNLIFFEKQKARNA